MATDKNTIKNWFLTGLKPTQAQFHAWMDAYWHKDEQIAQSNISGLTAVLNAKTENDQFEAHKVASDAHQALFDQKEDKDNKGVAGGYVPLNELAKIAGEYFNIINDLVTGGADAILSAEQGVVLQGQISAIQTLLASDDVDLDTVQELVDAIKEVETSLETILVNDLTTGGTTKALTAEMGKALKVLVDGLTANKTNSGGFVGTSQQLKTEIDGMYQPDVLIRSVAPTRVGNTFTYPSGEYEYLISKTHHINAADFVVTIPPATTDFKRTDLIYGKPDNTLAKLGGVESTTVAVRPDVPAGCVGISFINVFGATISDPTPIGRDISFQDVFGTEQFKVSDYIRFEGVSMNPAQKLISINPLVPLAAFLDIVSGNDITAAIGNSSKPFKTLAELVIKLPTHSGETYTIYINNGGVVPVTRRLPTRHFNFIAGKATTLDFTDCKEDDGITDATAVLQNVSGFQTRTWFFSGNNISIISNYVGVKYFGVINDNSLIALKGNIDTLNWKSTSTVAFKGFVLEAGTNIKINNCFNSTQNTVLFSGLSSDTDVHMVNYHISSNKLLNFSGRLVIDNIKKVGLSIFNASLGASTTKKIGNINFDDGTLQLGGTEVCEFFGKITGTCVLDLINIKIIQGTITSDTYCIDVYLNQDILYKNFTGKLSNLFVVGNGRVTFENCNINVKDSLVKKYSAGAGSTGAGSSIREDIIVLRGSNTIIVDSNPSNLPLFQSSANAAFPRINLKDYGSTKTNVDYYGDYVDVEYLANTFKERKKEVVIRSKKDLLNRSLKSDTTYIVDGLITLLTGEYIEVPTGGLTITGYGFDVSQVNKNVSGQSIFKSPATGGSGNIVSKDIQYNSGLGSVFDVEDSDGSHAIEFNDVNFVGCNSIGKFKGYRQFTGTTCGVYGCSNGFQLSGNWSGFKFTNSNVISFLSGGTLIKKDTDTLFSNRLYLDLNFAANTGAILSDFGASNFASDELFQINNTLASLNGSKDASVNTAILLPNITPNDPKARFTNCLGITVSAAKFQDLKSPDGNVWRLSVDNSGNIAASSV